MKIFNDNDRGDLVWHCGNCHTDLPDEDMLTDRQGYLHCPDCCSSDITRLALVQPPAIRAVNEVSIADGRVFVNGYEYVPVKGV